MKRKIEIFDTTLRDGEQSAGGKLNADEKLRIAKQLARLNVDVIEAGFPASSPGDLRAVSLIAQYVKGPIITALARCNKEDIEIAAKSLEGAEKPRIHIFLPSSNIHLKKKINMTKDEALNLAVESVILAKSFVEDVEYSPEDSTRSDFDYLARIIKAVIEAGATVVNIPDTVGYSTPQEFAELIKNIKKEIPELGNKVTLSVHCHNDLGMATANTLAALMNGAGQAEVTMNGVGERAGNTSLEEIVMAIKTRKDFFRDIYTDIVTEEIMMASRLVSDLMAIPVQPNKAIIGANAFAHSAGIHQDGVIKAIETYEIMKPEDVGIEESSKIHLTARSGKSGLFHRLKSLGYDIQDGGIKEKIYRRFVEIADQKKTVTNEDLKAIISDELMAPKETWRIESFSVNTGNEISPRASVKLSKDDVKKEKTVTGDGPVDAVYKAILDIVNIDIKLIDYSIRSASAGTDAIGEVKVVIGYNDTSRTASGRGSGTDIIEASARAFLMAINRLIEENNLIK